MKPLIKKELFSLLCSPIAIFFLVGFLVATGLMNWVFSGSFNILDHGYASLSNFFTLAPILFIILIPALTMRSFSEERRNKNLDIFRTRPRSLTSLYFSKLLSSWFVVFLALLSSTIYVYSIYILSSPVGNIDLNEILASYICLLFLSLVFISTGLFSSCLSKNQVVAFIIAICLNFICFYGFDLLASLFGDVKIQLFTSSIGLHNHYELMQKGVVQIYDLLVLGNYIFIFSILSIYLLSLKNKRDKKSLSILLSIAIAINIIFAFIPNIRFDFTSDKRYTISDYSKDVLLQLAEEKKTIHIKIYLEGDLNPGFQRLQNAVKDILSDFNYYGKNQIVYEFINPYIYSDNQDEVYSKMDALDMKGISLNEINREGKTSQRIIYPYAQLFSETDTSTVNLLKNIGGYSAEENLNASIENLEFQFIDAVRILNKKEAEAIAFIEGHGEIRREYVYDAEELLAKYFFVNRGQITNDISILDDFKVVIIAGSVERFTEEEKFVIDQYIMSGGRVLWLIDGVYLDYEKLKKESNSPSMKNDVNLDDMLFTYGVRINPVLIQDTQCSSTYLTSGETGTNQYIEAPWYYSPLLLPSINHPITKDISLIKTTFASSLDIVSNKNTEVSSHVLLTTSEHSHIVKAPEMISFDVSAIEKNGTYFDQSFLTVAIALEGKFTSSFQNRMIPEDISMNGNTMQSKSKADTKMIVASSSEIIRNELTGYNNQTRVLPMGYDKVAEKQYGNRDFIVNAVNWLASDNEWIALRSKEQQIRLLDRQTIYTKRNFYSIVNTIVPIILVGLIIGIFYFYRKRKYEN